MKNKTVIVYMSEDNGELYSKEIVESEHEISEDGEAGGFVKYEIDDKFELTAEQCCGHYGEIVGILMEAGKLRKV